MTVAEYQKKLIATIEAAGAQFIKTLPGIEQEALSRVLVLAKDIQTSNGKLVNSVDNLKKIGQLRKEMESAVFNKKFTAALQDFIYAFDATTAIHRKYFTEMDQRPPAEILKELQLQAKSAVIENLTKQIDVRIIPGVEEILRVQITTGGSYRSMISQLSEYIVGNGQIPGSFGKLSNLAATITVDALNNYSAEYSKTMTLELKWKWRMYVGSNLTTTREFCELMTKKEYVHEAELPGILKGTIDGKEMKLNEKTGLWLGAKEGTTITNIDINRGGWKCGHQFLAVPEHNVPVQIRIATYNKYGIKHKNGIAA